MNRKDDDFANWSVALETILSSFSHSLASIASAFVLSQDVHATLQGNQRI